MFSFFRIKYFQLYIFSLLVITCFAKFYNVDEDINSNSDESSDSDNEEFHNTDSHETGKNFQQPPRTKSIESKSQSTKIHHPKLQYEVIKPLLIARPKPYHGYKIPRYIEPEFIVPNKDLFNIRKIHIFEEGPTIPHTYSPNRNQFQGSDFYQSSRLSKDLTDRNCKTVYRKIRTKRALNTFKCSLCLDRFTNDEYEMCEIISPFLESNVRSKRAVDNRKVPKKIQNNSKVKQTDDQSTSNEEDMSTFFKTPIKFKSGFDDDDFFGNYKSFPSMSYGINSNEEHSKETVEESSAEKSPEDNEHYSQTTTRRNAILTRNKNSNNQLRKKNNEDADCVIVKQGTSTCTVCYNEQTGGKSERCSYTSSPKDESYAYTHESKYSSKDSKDNDGSSEENNKHSRNTYGVNESAESRPKNIKKIKNTNYPTSIQDKLENNNFQNMQKLKTNENTIPGYKFLNENKINVQKALNDFHKRNRTNCKRLKKGEMNCFICQDNHGIKRKECVYLSRDRRSPKILPSNHNKTTMITSGSKKINRKRQVDEDNQSEENSKSVENSSNDNENANYSFETKSVFDKSIGFYLPRYMLDKSDFESEFDHTMYQY